MYDRPRVGAMNDLTGDFVTVLVDERTFHRVGNLPDPQLGQYRRAWHGDVFFDHVRGIIDPNPTPLVEDPPFLLVSYYRDFDWTSQHDTRVKEFTSAAALIEEARALVASERASGSSNVELWEVYGVRVRERRPRPRKPRRVDGVDARLIEDIRNAPADDGPRLVWADAVGGERGELVVIQLDLERGGLSPREVIARRKRQRELLARHGAAWSGLAGIARRASFRRGFVDAAELPAATFVEHADALVEAAPLLSSLTATGLRADGPSSDPIPLLSTLCADPVARELRGLELSFAADDRVDDRAPAELALEQIVGSKLLRQLRALGVQAAVGMHGVRVLANPRSLHEVERLWLRDVNDVDAMHALLTAGGLTSLRSFVVGQHCPLARIAHLIPPTVTELLAGNLGHDGLATLAKSPVATTLEHLDVEEGLIDFSLFAAFPRLRSLWIHQAASFPPGDEQARSLRRALSSSPLRALRELAITAAMREPPMRVIVDELGPQLELLDLRNTPAALRFVNELKPKVAGELLVGEVPLHRRQRSLLRVGPMTQLPWWDHVTLA